MKVIRFANAVVLAALATGGTTTFASDFDTSELPTEPVLTLAMAEDLDQPLTTARHGVTPKSSRTAAPHLISERPPRPPVAMEKSRARPEAEGARVSARHIFPPRGFPRW